MIHLELEDEGYQVAEDHQEEAETGQEMVSSHNLRLEGPRHQLGQEDKENDEGEAVVGYEHVGDILEK